MNPAIKLMLMSSFGVAMIFSVFSLIFYFGNWPRLFIVFTAGFFIGLVAAPEFDQKAFKYPALCQFLSGCLAGGAVAALFTFDLELMLMSGFIGGFVGWLTPYWLKYIPVP